MDKHPAPIPSPKKTDQDPLNAILQGWLKELQDNPHFSNESFSQNENLVPSSKRVLASLLTAAENPDMPDLSQTSLDPVLKLWHQLLQDQSQIGLTTKDSTLLLFALKTSLAKAMKNQSHLDPAATHSFSKIAALLDVLGVLTFEVYTLEKEKLITRQSEQISYLQSKDIHPTATLIGNSPTFKAVFQAISLVLDNDVTLLLQGESGTGKDLIATMIHENSKRKNKPFVALNCGAIPKDLIESELFGHEKGAFTGADTHKIGKFELAHDGTLFLDEVGELPFDLQVKFLRALQNKEIERVGGKDKIKVTPRIIAATNKNLKLEVEKGRFRQDLYFRLNVFPITVPPLRDRKEDILPLAHFFIQKYGKEFNLPAPTLTQDAQHYLLHQTWEGNVRELENLIQRAVILAQGQPITATLFQLQPGTETPLILPAKPPTVVSSDILTLDALEKNAIATALSLKKNNIQQTAKALGISRTTLYQKMKKYGIVLP